MSLFRLIGCGLLFLFALPTFAQTPPATLNLEPTELDFEALGQYLPAGSDFALLVAPPDLSTIYQQHRSEQLQAPASTQKLLTALAARLYLPEDFRFSTRLERQGDDVILRFSGDPTLKRTDLRVLIKQLSREVREINGDILLDNSIFTGYERAVGWPWDILGVCYSAPASALTLDRNCVQGALYRNQMPGHIARATVPRHQPVLVASNTKIVSPAEQKRRICDLELISNGRNQYQLGGCITPGPDVLPLRFAVQNTELYITSVIKAELKRAGISFNGTLHTGRFNQGRMVAEHFSKPLPELLTRMLKASDNLIADNLSKTLGQRYYQRPGTFARGSAAIKAILLDQAGIDLNHAVLTDGSGLSRNNRLTAQQLAKVVSYIYQNEASLGLYSKLPRSGIDGTLRYRASMRHTPLKGALRAKSGSLFGAYNLAGVLTTAQGEPLLVIQLVNNYHPPAQAPKTKALAPIWRFERALFEQLHQRPTTTAQAQ